MFDPGRDVMVLRVGTRCCRRNQALVRAGVGRAGHAVSTGRNAETWMLHPRLVAGDDIHGHDSRGLAARPCQRLMATS